ncbi:MAG: TlpA family protein disulfide reductase [Actinomycetota bacterium]
MRRTRRAAEVAIIVLVVAGISGLLIARRGSQPSGSRGIGGPAGRGCDVSGVISEGERIPDDCLFETLPDGKFVSLGQARDGKPLVLNFWASRCLYCIKEMPDFQRVYEQASGRVAFLGLDLLGVQGETKSAAVKLAGETGVHYPLGYDQGAELYARLTPRLLMPTTILVRASGVVALRQFGPLTADQLRDLIRKHLDVDLEG